MSCHVRNARRFSASILSTEEAILRASKIGLRFVELTSWKRNPLEGKIQSLRRALDSVGVTPATFHGPIGVPFDIGNFDSLGRKDAIAKHKQHMQYCSSLGAKCYVIHPGFEVYGYERGGGWDDVNKTATFPREEGTIGKLWETNASSLAELGDFGASLGTKIAMETGPPSIWTPAETFRVVRLANSRNLGICVDTGHINVGGKFKPSDVIREAGSLVWALHLQDNKGDGDWHLAPGRGNIDWRAVASALRDVSYDGALTLEVGASWWKDEEIWSAIEEGVSFLTGVLGGL